MRLRYAGGILLLFLSSSILTNGNTITAFGDPASELGVELSSHILTAGSNNSVTLRVWNRGKYLSNLDVSINVPPPLALFGDNRWLRPNFKGGDAIQEELTIFAPNSAAGITIQLTLTAVYKEAGEDTFSTETHLIGLLVRGWIDILVYELVVDPQPVIAGRSVTISGNILNRGIIPAMFTNVTLESSRYVLLGPQSVSYIGQVDPNAPAPFSLSATIDASAPESGVVLTVSVYYQNDLHEGNTFRISTQVPVTRTLPPEENPQPRGILDQILGEYLIVTIALVLVGIAAVALAFRRRRKHREF